jgi:signal transduction histidine kinase
VRARTGVVLLGTLGGFTPPVVMLSMMYGLGVPFPLNYATLTFVLFPIGIGYAIARLDLFDIDRIIRRTLAYAMLSALVLIVYLVAINAIDYTFENLTALGSRVAEGLVILAVLLLSSRSRERIQDFVDRVYDRHRYDYRDVVRSTSRTFATILDFEKLVNEAMELVDRTLQPVAAKLYSVAPNGTTLLHGTLVHEPAAARRIETDLDGAPDEATTRLGNALAHEPLVALWDTRGSSTDSDLARELVTAGGEFAAAMTLEGRLVGFLTIGPKRSGLHYTSDDHELCRTICDQLAVALQNAQAYETIDSLNDDLAHKNVALETANRDLRNAQDELVRKERLAALGELSGAVAHAIRNPLAGIKAAAQLAALDLDGHPAAESLEDVISEADRLDRRIGALLQFSKPFEPSFRRADLARVIDQAIRDTSAKAAARRVAVQRNPQKDLPDCEMDPLLMEQAVLELVSNAIDASPDGGNVTIDAARAAENRDWVRIEVTDAGRGIDERAAGRLFDLFYTTKDKGTGFGLATVRKVVEAHGGTIAVSNRPTGGTSFRIDVPIAARATQRSPNFSTR